MANTTDTTEGAQPLAAPEAASWSTASAPVGDSFHHSGDAPLPLDDAEGSYKAENSEDLTSGADGALSPSLNPANVDELIAALPERVVESLSATDIEALASGNPQAVARILAELPDGNHENPPASSASPEEAAAPTPPQQADGGPERISLRGLSTQDRIALADLVRAVKDGRYASLDEARAALQPSPVAAQPAHSHSQAIQADASGVQENASRPQARARGMVASPSARGAAALSLEEAFEQIGSLSESEVDAVLTQMRERERASRFSRAA